MKKHLVTLLTGLTAVSMAASMPVAVFAAESDAAAETTAEADQEVTMDTQEHAETTEPVAKALEAAKETEPSASTPEVQEETETSEPESVTSTPEVHEETVQNADGSTTTTTTSTITETTTTPLDPMVTTTPVNKEDSDYHTITDEDGNELEAYEKTTTTASSEVSTETVTTTTVTTETSQMTNAVETENATVENVTDAGNVTQADAETETAAKEFLEDQNVTSDFAIYADKVDESIGHVDGNVAVNTMATGGQVDIMNKDDSQYGAGNADPYAGNGYSYVGSTENGTTIKTTSNQTKDGEVLSKLVVGEDVTVTDNAHGSAGHFQLEMATTKEEGGVTSESASHLAASDSRLADLEKTSDINQNLDQIAESGQKLIDATKDENGTGSADNDLNKIAAAIESLVQRQSSDSENGTNILNVTIHSRLLTDSRYTNDLNNRKIFQDLVKKNTSNTKVIVSVDCSDTDDSTGITAYFNPSNDINNYDNKAANLYWNFGSYKGKITFESQWIGNIIAANATVHANAGIQSGRIVARTAGHKAGEIHMAVSGNVATKKVTSEPVVTRSDKKTVIISSEPSVTYRYRPKDKTSEPDQPSEPTVPTEPSEPDQPSEPTVPTEPSEPDQPSTPTVPDTPAEPDQPTTPVVPDTPSEPSQPTNPDVPENPSLPDNPDVPGTTDYTNPDTPDTDTNVVTTSVSEEPSAVENNIGDVSLINDESSHGEEQSQMVLGEIRTSETSVGLGEEQLAAGGSDRKNVQTGDESNIVLWGSLAAAALSAFGFVIEIKKRRF